MNIINRIVEYEWEMFQKLVTNQKKLECRNNKYMFLLMRLSQWNVYPINVQSSYLNDIHEALSEKRNLLFEKYAYIMILSGHLAERDLRNILPIVNSEKEELVNKIINHHRFWYEAAKAKLPLTSSAGRPIVYGGIDKVDIYTYLKGELFTYGMNTLIGILETENMMMTQNKNLVIEIYKNYVKYNYEAES